MDSFSLHFQAKLSGPLILRIANQLQFPETTIMYRSILQFLIRLIKTPHFSRFRPTWDKLKRHFDYPKWQQLQTRSPTQRLPHHPLISVILPTYNTPSAFLIAAIESVIDQSYPDWELCIADDASTAPHVREILMQYRDQERDDASPCTDPHFDINDIRRRLDVAGRCVEEKEQRPCAPCFISSLYGECLVRKMFHLTGS